MRRVLRRPPLGNPARTAPDRPRGRHRIVPEEDAWGARGPYRADMARLSRIDAVFVAATAGTWLGLAVWTTSPAIDRLFIAVMVSSLLYLLRLGALAWLAAGREQRRAAGVRLLRPDDVARAAVEEERGRLSADIARCLRDSMADVRADAHVAAGADDPVPSLLRIQAHTRRATSELRRQLGLLRNEAPVTRGGSNEREASTPSPSRRDLLWGAAVSVLALFEVTVYLVSQGPGEGSVYSLAGSIGLSVVAAASIALRRTSPVSASLWCAAAFGLGTLLGAPVTGGFWAIATLGSLSWTLAATAPVRMATPVTWALFTGVIVHSRLVDDPDNAFMFALVIGVATGFGAAARLYRIRGHRAAASARIHGETLEQSARAAVAQERREFGREVHDVVSHAVGLVALQAAAAEVSWPHDPEAVRRAIAVIGATADSTLAELDRLLPGAANGEGPRLEDLLERIRAAGTSVRLAHEGTPQPALDALTYRIVQEGLTNAMRHAPGAAVSVSLRSGPDGLEVLVADDGPGPDARRQPGYGLVGLDERVAQAGGSLTAGRAPGGQGFLLQARVPARTVQAAP